MGLIRELRWQSRFLPAHVRQNLSPPELQVRHRHALADRSAYAQQDRFR